MTDESTNESTEQTTTVANIEVEAEKTPTPPPGTVLTTGAKGCLAQNISFEYEAEEENHEIQINVKNYEETIIFHIGDCFLLLSEVTQAPNFDKQARIKFDFIHQEKVYIDVEFPQETWDTYFRIHYS